MPLAIYPWQEALSRDLEIFRHRMPSGIIVSGPRDIGTFELVLAFTKSLMCENPAEDGTPCGKCPGCRLAEAGTHPDIRFLLSEEEAARHDLPIPESAGKKLSDEISIAAVRELRDYMALKPHRSPRRVILISPADRIRPDAASVLLKMVEEPPPDLSFIMIAEDLDAILPTLRSRCVLLHARKPDPEAASSWLESKGLKDFDEQLAEAGGNPLAVVRGHKIVPDEARTLFLNLLKAGKRLDITQVAPGVGTGWKLDACADFLSRWGTDLIRVKSGLQPSYFVGETPELQSIAPRADLQALFHWLDETESLKRASTVPLNNKLALEKILESYRSAFRS
jgi:DNA polymerase-3 subunit delta'